MPGRDWHPVPGGSGATHPENEGSYMAIKAQFGGGDSTTRHGVTLEGFNVLGVPLENPEWPILTVLSPAF
jgi:hypothetical protein